MASECPPLPRTMQAACPEPFHVRRMSDAEIETVGQRLLAQIKSIVAEIEAALAFPGKPSSLEILRQQHIETWAALEDVVGEIVRRAEWMR